MEGFVSSIKIPLSLMGSDTLCPQYAHKGDAALDLRAAISGMIKPHDRLLVPCGFSMALPKNCAGLVLPRSGLAAKQGITVLNAPGLIDSSYRGEIKVCLYNSDTSESFSFKKGDRIAQLLIVLYPAVEFNITDSLDETERGEQGFGSSGLS